jgi:hypothetical protein
MHKKMMPTRRGEGGEIISDPNSLYKPNALAEQLKEEAKRGPTVRLGLGAYGDASTGDGSVASAKQYADENSARKRRH